MVNTFLHYCRRYSVIYIVEIYDKHGGKKKVSVESKEYSYDNIFTKEKKKQLPVRTVLGIDIGSRQGKAVLLNDGKIYLAIEPTGFSMQKTAENLKNDLVRAAGIQENDIEFLIGTGYGRVSMEFDDIPNDMLTEISCHGMGAAFLSENIKTILDIGGQDSKIIKINGDNGQVLDFAMNDKCAAGTGRFLERAAELLGYEVTQIGDASLHATKIHEISSQCVVFAESEIVSARASGAEPVDILAGVHASVIGRVKGLFKRIGIEKEVLFTGGVSNNIGMRKALEDMLGFKTAVPALDSVYAGALGAAIYAAKRAEIEAKKNGGNKKANVVSLKVSDNKSTKSEKDSSGIQTRVDLTSINAAVEQAKQDYIDHKDGLKNAAYICAYTPLELLDAAGVRHIRLFHTGNEQEIAAGETVVSKIACDHTKSLVGGFAEGKPLYRAVDKLFFFYTCSFMNSAIRAVNVKYVPLKSYMFPKLLKDDRSKWNLVQELEEFRSDLEEFVGHKISDSAISDSIRKYNLARKLMREISAYRKSKHPILSGLEYQQITVAYYYLPVDVLLGELYQVLGQLKLIKRNRTSRKEPLRIMLTGGIVTEEDHKVLKILEEDFGAIVVVEDHCSGYAPFVMTIQEDQPVLEAISSGYLGKAPCANQKPLTLRGERTLELANEYLPDGVVYYFMQFCPTHGMAKQSIMEQLGENGYPSIDISGSYSSGDEGQLRTRLEAFIEILKKKRGEKSA